MRTCHRGKMMAFTEIVLFVCLFTSGIFYVGAGRCNDGTAQKIACKLLNFATSGSITLWNQHASGVSDNAYAYNNIEDTCNGYAAKRSSYQTSCPRGSGPAPGGEICLSSAILRYIDKVRQELGQIHVNEIAGACHSTNSKHYLGRAVDLHKYSSSDARTMLSLCKGMRGRGNNERSHVHCQI